MHPTDLESLRTRLLTWYDAHRRPLPWRTSAGDAPDPYRIWVSEAMLQQTRVETVEPYFARWLERFPTLDSLASASLDDVLKAWEGLGYYSRARNLHRAVREVTTNHAGRVPDDPELFRSLPGVGRYTAGAVMSIAFDREEPIVDGNVRRVFARWLDQPRPEEQDLWELAADLVIGERPGCLNQAVMELGALVCTPRSPRCSDCPVHDRCAAFRAGTQHERPMPRRSAPLPREHRVAAVIRRDDLVLITRRAPAGRLGGMWEFPGSLIREGESYAAAAERTAREVVGIGVRARADLAPVNHTFTHVRVGYQPVLCDHSDGEPRAIDCDAWRWIHPEGLDAHALPRAQQKIAGLAFTRTRE